jgi:signal transduction histidine kinase
MTQNEIEHIFNRFYKADTSRNTEGFGIGLSLAKKIADIYNWNITVESEKGK